MPNIHLLGHAILIAVLLVVALQLAVAYLHRSLHLGYIHQGIAQLALLRNRIHVGSLILFVIGLQFFFARMNAFSNFVGIDNGVIELNFRVSLMKLVVDFGIGNNGCARNEGAQLGRHQAILFQLFEFSHRQVGLLQHVFVFLLSDKLAAGKKRLAILPVLKFVLQLFVADFDAHILGSHQHGLGANQVLVSPLTEVREHLLRHGIPTRKLLPQHATSSVVDLLRSNLLAAHGSDHTFGKSRAAQSHAVPNASGNEGDHHRNADEGKQRANNNLLRLTFSLEKANHSGLRLRVNVPGDRNRNTSL